MVTEKKIKEFIEQNGFVRINQFEDGSERTVRRVVSGMRKEGRILISVKREPNLRVAIESCTEEEVNEYARIQMASMGTQYFNTLKPIKDYIKNQKLLELMGEFEMMFDGKNGQFEMRLEDGTE